MEGQKVVSPARPSAQMLRAAFAVRNHPQETYRGPRPATHEILRMSYPAGDCLIKAQNPWLDIDAFIVPE